MHRSRFLILALLVCVGGGGATAAAAPRELARAGLPGPVTSGGGVAVWTGGEAGSLRLMALRGGQVVTPGVPGRSVPFDVDLGSSGGRTVAAFSRCTREPELRFGPLPRWTTGRGCRLRVLDVARGTERTLLGASAGTSAVLPSVDGTRVAYVRVVPARRRAELVVAPMRPAGGRVRAVASFPLTATGRAPVALDLGPRGLAYTTTVTTGDDAIFSELWVVRGDGRPRRIRRLTATALAGRRLTGPTWRGSRIAVGEVRTGEEVSTRLLEVDPATGRQKGPSVAGPENTVAATPLAGGTWITARSIAAPFSPAAALCAPLLPADQAGCPVTTTG